MQIVIPSKGRSDTIGQRTLPLFPDAVVTVDEREVGDYLPLCKNLLAHPPLDSLAEILNWILDYFSDEIVVIVEDDIIRCVSFTGIGVREYRNPLDVYQIIANCAECAQGAGARLFGFTTSGNPIHFHPQDPISFVTNIYTVYGYVGKGLKNDPHRRLFRNLDTALTTLMRDRIVYCDTRFHFDSIAPLKQRGGNAENRARERLAEANQSMLRKWGNRYVKIGDGGDIMLVPGSIKRRQAKVGNAGQLLSSLRRRVASI